MANKLHYIKYFTTQYLSNLIIITLSILLGCLFNLVGYPVLLVLLFYRKVVLYCSKWRHKTWIPINIASGHFAVDVVNAHGLKAFGCCLDVDKSFDYKGWIERIQKFLDSEKRPELKCFLHRWFGTYFLVQCKHFVLKDVILVDHINLPSDKVHQYLLDFTTKPFKKQGPLWEIGIFPDLKPDVCTISWRIHHSLADGLSLMSFVAGLCDSDPGLEQKLQHAMNNLKEKYMPKRSFYLNLLIALEFVFISPCYFMYKILHSIENNMWNSAVCNGPLLQIRHVLDVNLLKQISKGLKTKFLTLLAATLTGTMIEEIKDRRCRIGENISLLYVLPMPRNLVKETLTNAVVSTIIHLPTGVEDRAKRLLTIDKAFATVKRPGFVLFCRIFQTLSHLLGSLCGKQTIKKMRYCGSGGWSNLCVFMADLKIKGKEMSNFSTIMVPPMHCVPIVLVSATWNNDLVLNFAIDKSLMRKKKDLEIFANRIDYELLCYSNILRKIQ